MLRHIAEERFVAGDTVRNALLFKQNQVCLYPPHSLVKNIGNDGSGKNCSINKNFARQPVYSIKIEFNSNKPVTVNVINNKQQFRYFGGTIAKWRSVLIFNEFNSCSNKLKLFYRSIQLSLGFILRIKKSTSSFIKYILKKGE
jgi:hypothetical protein